MKKASIAVLFVTLFSLIALSCTHTKFPFGKRIYLSQCADCHMDDGKGLSALYPSLRTESVVAKINDIPCIIRDGITDTTSLIKMLPMPQLSDVEITNVINYIMQDLNRSNKELNLPQVQQLLDQCKTPNQ